MNKVQSNQMAMLLAVYHVFKNFNEIPESIPALSKFIAEFINRMNLIEIAHREQEGHSTANAAQKLKEENEMIDLTITLAAAIYVYAMDQGNLELAAKVDKPASYYGTLKQSSLIAFCRNVLDLAKGLVDQLADYGISQATVDAMEKEIAGFASVIVAPRQRIVSRSEATKRLDALLREQMNLLKHKLDKMMLMFRSSHPNFYQSYKNARIIVNIGTRHKTETTINN